MSRINLLPPEFRRPQGGALSLQQRKTLLILGGSLFVGLTVFFLIQYHFISAEFKKLEPRWMAIQRDVQRVAALQLEIEGGSKSEKEFLERYVTSPLPVTQILSKVTEALPDSVWLVELKVSRQPQENTFLVKGFSMPTSGRSGIQDIERYLRELKGVFPTQTEVMLTTSRQTRENRELTLFTALFKWL